MSVELKAKKYITPLRINKLRGRMLRMPAPKGRNREILFIAGHHTSLERMYGFCEYMNRYGAVTMPDLPGFGGMTSFYKIGKQPTIDNFADYLASFIKLQYKRRRFIVFGYSFSFLVITRMLQKYPDIAKRVDFAFSFVGFVHKDDFQFSFWQHWGIRTLAFVFRFRITSLFMHYVMFSRPVVTYTYKLISGWHYKMRDLNEAKQDERIEFEANLWKINDARTRMKTITEMLTADLGNKMINLPVYHVSVKNDHYFDHKIVEQHMRILYKDFVEFKSKFDTHTPGILASARDIAPIIPPSARRLFLR